MLLPNMQLEEIERNFSTKIFLEGPSGAGKTSLALKRLENLIEAGVPGETIMIFVPQRTLGSPYINFLRENHHYRGSMVSLLTIGGMARRAVDLFWPVVAESAGFPNPRPTPRFLTLETAQYFMAHVIEPLWEKGLFQTLTIDRNRIYGQILDNLNKAALVGFPHQEIGEKLKSAWIGKPEQKSIYDDAQTCALLFRQYCLENSLLDFSLQVEIFRDYILSSAFCRQILFAPIRHLIYDNIEEDAPLSHDLIGSLLEEIESALLIYDWDAGYRRFLAADPVSAYSLKPKCDVPVELHDNLVTPPELKSIAYMLVSDLPINSPQPDFKRDLASLSKKDEIEKWLKFSRRTFVPEMLEWVADEVVSLVNLEGISPGEIAILSPYMPDVLRFLLEERLSARQIPVRTHRPSRALKDEPAVQSLITLSCLAYPEWGLYPSKQDFTFALMHAIEDMDLVRAHLFSEITYRIKGEGIEITSFDLIKAKMQSRLTFLLGERFELLRKWLLDEANKSDEFDYFLTRLFGEILSQPGYGFHRDYDAVEGAYNLIESVQKFRQSTGDILASEGISLGREYVRMLHSGVLAAQYLTGWEESREEAVLISPVFAFLMRNKPVDIQFWLDISSGGWSERLFQPLTHPYVLNRQWKDGDLWTDEREQILGFELLQSLVLGLTGRCRKRIYMGHTKLNAMGYEMKGPLLQALQRAILKIVTTN